MERISWVWKTLRHTSWVQSGLPDLGPGKLTTQLHHGHLQFPEGFLNPAQRSAASHSNKDKTHSWLQESLQLCKEQYSLFQMVAIRLQDSERNTLYTLKSTKWPMTSITYREQWLKLTVSLGQSVWMTQCVHIPSFPGLSVGLQAQRGSRGRIRRPWCESPAEWICHSGQDS